MKDQLARLKEIEIEMLIAVISTCEKLGLKYYMLGGTLLGAVRHKGFIPWDDDIDIGMLRKDYDVFVKKAQAFLPESLFVQTYITDPNFPMNFCKIRNSETTFIESSIKNLKINHGVFIDVFPLDFHPDNKLSLKRYDLKNKLLISRISEIYASAPRSIPRKIKHFFARIPTFCLSVNRAVQARDNLMKSCKESSRIANYCGAWGEKEIVPKEWYGEGTLLEFEGLWLNAPKEYDKWLTQVYGEYMKLPPAEKHVTQHYTDIID